MIDTIEKHTTTLTQSRAIMMMPAKHTDGEDNNTTNGTDAKDMWMTTITRIVTTTTVRQTSTKTRRKAPQPSRCQRGRGDNGHDSVRCEHDDAVDGADADCDAGFTSWKNQPQAQTAWAVLGNATSSAMMRQRRTETRL